MDGRTVRFAISISCVSMLTCDKNCHCDHHTKTGYTALSASLKIVGRLGSGPRLVDRIWSGVLVNATVQIFAWKVLFRGVTSGKMSPW